MTKMNLTIYYNEFLILIYDFTKNAKFIIRKLLETN